VTVNVSADHFVEDTFIDDVGNSLSASGFDPGHLTIVLAETALASDRLDTMARLNDLRQLGVRVALGEFDSGSNFLTFLQRYPIDVLKVDRSLLAGMAGPDGTDAMEETLIQLGRVFSMEIVIEGDRTVDAAGTWADSQVPVTTGP
jgi:EAL domain-containing protein (putative c-di-GMP-specific phosphodiesterase class I)